MYALEFKTSLREPVVVVVAVVLVTVVVTLIAFCINCQRKSVCHSTGFPFPVAR